MKRMFGCFLLLGLLIATAVMAAVPNQMNVQGRLLNAGSPMSGSHPAVFRIFDAATDGTNLWTEDTSLDVQGGIFTATLGTTTPIPTILFDASSRWLEVSVDGNILTPRLELTTSAYAFRSQHADTAGYALNAPPTGDNLWSTDGTNVWRTDGMVGIGVVPSASLTIDALTGGSSGRARLFYDSSIYPSIYGEIYHNGDQSGLTLQSRGSNIGSGDISFWTGQTTPVERMRVHYDGGVSIPNTLTTGTLSTNTLNATSIGMGPGTPWASPGICLDAGSQTTPIRWDNRASCGFLMYQPQGSNQFNFNSIGGGSWETWRWVSAGLGELFVIGPTITSNRTVQINGDLNVSGALNVTGTKCRIVMSIYGQVKMNAVEAGHALFMDDEPSARLVSGKCRINLSPKFLATVTVNGKYPLAVNVTIYGRHGADWYVERDATGFTVIDPSGGNNEFSWQAIARQKGYEDTYLETVETQTANRHSREPERASVTGSR